MRLHRLRIAVDDEPGRFGMVAAGLGSMGVNILDLDIHSGPDGERIDELTADLTLPVDIPAIGHAVTTAGGRLLDISAVDAHDLRDGVTSAIELATRLVADGAPHGDVLQDTARRLVRAELSWIAGSSGIDAGHGVLRQVRQSRSALQIDAPLKRLPARDRPTWWLGLPWTRHLDDDLAVLVLVRRTDRFTFTEVARVQALLRLHETAHQTLRTH